MISQKYVAECDVCGETKEYNIEPTGLDYKKLKIVVEVDNWDRIEYKEVEIDMCKECIKKYFGELKEKAFMKVDKCYEYNKDLYKDIKSVELKNE